MNLKFALLAAAVLLLNLPGIAAAEGDCEFCKKDHRKVCADECAAGDKSEGCPKKCVQSKCVKVCGDSKKEKGEGKKNKGDKKDKDPKKDDKKEGKKGAKDDAGKTPKEGKKNGNKDKANKPAA